MSKTKSTKKYKLNPLAVVALVLCALIAVYCGTTAWLTSGVPLNPLRLTSLQDFVYSIEVSTNGGETWAPKSEVLTFAKEDIGNLANVCFRVKQAGNGVAFTRVRISQEWVTSDGKRLQGEYNLPFIVAENDKLFDNRFTDGFVYYKGAFPISDEGVEIFSGFDFANFDTSAIPSGVTLRIDVTVDAVQFNRYQQFWGIDALPWR
ncbi:MAG: hypothetical protein IKL41_05995 [Clostridia bacterium]|nr:hypothetical protein [Clostridia bacterium]MBR6635159.1 hypothetical protein [Clostridia bacterium]